jgi:hypothetical protein
MLAFSTFLAAHINSDVGSDSIPFIVYVIIALAIGGLVIYELFKKRN